MHSKALTHIIRLQQKLEACLLSSSNINNVVGSMMQDVKSTASEGILGGVTNACNLHQVQVITQEALT